MILHGHTITQFAVKGTKMALDKNIAISIVVLQFASAVSYELFARGQMVPSVKTRLTKWDLTDTFL